jgi:hypothetical protein
MSLAGDRTLCITPRAASYRIIRASTPLPNEDEDRLLLPGTVILRARMESRSVRCRLEGVEL